MDDDPTLTPSLLIDRMRLTLPPGYASRAGAIANRIASELAAQLAGVSLPRTARIDSIAVPAVTVRAGETDAALAIRIAGSIRAEIARGVSAPGQPGFGPQTPVAPGAAGAAANPAAGRTVFK